MHACVWGAASISLMKLEGIFIIFLKEFQNQRIFHTGHMKGKLCGFLRQTKMLRTTNGGNIKRKNEPKNKPKHGDVAQNHATLLSLSFEILGKKETIPALLAHCLQGF